MEQGFTRTKCEEDLREALGKKWSPGPGLSQAGIMGLLRAWCLPTHSRVCTHTHTVSSDTQQKFHAILRPECLLSVPICPFRRAHVLLQSLLTSPPGGQCPTPTLPALLPGHGVCGKGRNSICGCQPVCGLRPVGMTFLRMGPAQCERELIWAGSPLCAWPHPVTFSE